MSSKSSIQVKLVLDEEMRNEEIINEIRKIVENACKKETNYFGYGIWTHHITSVVKWAKTLARKSNADEEIVEIAALLHDYASIVNINNYSGHHTCGAELAEEIKNMVTHRIKSRKLNTVLLHTDLASICQGKLLRLKLLPVQMLCHFSIIFTLCSI